MLGGIVDQDVRRLDVAVDQAALVRGVERSRDLLEHEERTPHAQPPLLLRGASGGRGLDVAHGDVEEPVGIAPFDLAGVVDRDHVGVVELGRPLRLADEPLAEAVVVRKRRGEHLEGNLAAEAHVLGEVHDAHPAAPSSESTR